MYRKDGVVRSKGYVKVKSKISQLAYERIGYSFNDEKLYGYSFLFPDFKPKQILTKKFFTKPVNEFSFVEAKHFVNIEKNIKGLRQILSKKPTLEI